MNVRVKYNGKWIKAILFNDKGTLVYKNRFCEHCGCNIPYKKSHERPNVGIPTFINGHNRLEIGVIPITKEEFKLSNKVILKGSKLVYKNCFCKCCGKNIPYKESHIRTGIPEFIHGHNPSDGKDMVISGLIGRKIKRGEHISPETEFKNGHEPLVDMKGKNNPNYGGKWGFKKGKLHLYYGKHNSTYEDGYGRERTNCRSRGVGFIPLNDKTKEANTMHHVDSEQVIFIPQKLHESVWHSLKYNVNMDVINDLAYEYLFNYYYKHKSWKELLNQIPDEKEHNFGFIPLNTYFRGSAAHHIDSELVIYIPIELHTSVNHSVVNDINMTKINNLACNYLFSEYNWNNVK